MSTTSHTYLPRDSHHPRGRRLWCAKCNTDRHLLVDSVTTLNAQQQTLAAAITCSKCGGSRVVATTAAFVAEVPMRNEDNSDVVHRDAAYVHCQEPMSPADPGSAVPLRIPNGNTTLMQAAPYSALQSTNNRETS